MLILTRRIGETIVINDTILVTVTAVHGNQVRLGITAPKEVSILREELAKRPRPVVISEHDIEVAKGHYPP